MSELDDIFARLCSENSPRIQLVSFSKPERESGFLRIRVRPITVKNRDAFQAEQFTADKAFQKNLDAAELREYLTTQAVLFRQILAETADETLTVLRGKKDSKTDDGKEQITVLRRKKTSAAPECTPCRTMHAADDARNHNRVKRYLLAEGIPVPFLRELGIQTETGAVKARKQDKFRQINRFLEFVNDVLPVLTKTGGGSNRALSIIDFGCGKSYLTFAVYYFLSEIKGLKTRITGLDLKTDVIGFCSALAEKTGYSQNMRTDGCGMEFLNVNASDYRGSSGEQTDLVISLHACDTATDYALAFAAEQQAQVILSVPCCQHELNAGIKSLDAPLSLFAKHGVVKERFAALATDVLRAEKLEQAGYAVQIIEFTDMADTPKNLLLRAVKKSGGRRRNPDTADYDALRDALGVTTTLEKLL